MSLQENVEENNAIQVREVQQTFFEYFGDRDWDLYEENEHVILKRIIGFALFDRPGELPSHENETGYNSEQNDEINKLYKLFLNNNFTRDKKICMRIIYICYYYHQKDDELVLRKTPVFVLKKCQEQHGDDEYSSQLNCKIFIDNIGRVYDNWESYLNENTLPKCTMVCPQDGQYKGMLIDDEAQVLLEYHESPACGIKNQILNAADVAGTAVSVLTTLGALGTMVVSAPALGVATAVGGIATSGYMVSRNIYTLADRGTHQQSVGLDNSESRWSWFGITTGVVGTAATATSGIVRTMASQGRNISRSAQMTLNVLNVANMAGSTTGIIFCGYNLVDKYRNNESISALEVFQFSASILFFYRSVVDFQTAESLISRTQEDVLKNYEDTLRSNRHRKVYRKALKETERLNGKVAGRAEVISGINNIADKDAFFAGLVRINKDVNKVGARFEITADGNVRINSAHIVDPNEFASMNRGARASVLNSLPPRQDTIPQTVFNNSQSIVNDNIAKLKNLAPIGMGASKIIIKIINNPENIEDFAFLLANFARETVRRLFQILYKFLDEIQSRFNDFTTSFPMANVAVGCMQFLINRIKESAFEIQLEIDEFIICLFNEDGSINRQFVDDTVREFNAWLDERLSYFRNRPSTSENGERNDRKRKDCKICKGYYFDD